jgi:hypothetical protein
VTDKLPEDDVARMRHELADVEAALEDASEDEREGLETLRRQLEAEIAEAQNPVSAPAEVVDVDPEDFKHPGRDLVVAPGAERHEVFEVLDAHDEDLILEEMQRRALKVMLYDFPQDGSRVIDLSYQGVMECVRVLNASGKARITIAKGTLKVERETIDGVDYYVAEVFAEEQVTGHGEYGIAREPLYMKLKDERSARRQREKGNLVHERNGQFYIFDPFARTKAVNKAQRNALKTQIPERIRQALIAMAKKDEEALKTIAMGAGAAEYADLPAPADSPEAKQITAECRAIYSEIRGLSVTSLLPGQFNAKLSRAAHDESLLAALRDELQSRLDHLKAAAT